MLVSILWFNLTSQIKAINHSTPATPTPARPTGESGEREKPFSLRPDKWRGDRSGIKRFIDARFQRDVWIEKFLRRGKKKIIILVWSAAGKITPWPKSTLIPPNVNSLCELAGVKYYRRRRKVTRSLKDSSVLTWWSCGGLMKCVRSTILFHDLLGLRRVECFHIEQQQLVTSG